MDDMEMAFLSDKANVIISLLTEIRERQPQRAAVTPETGKQTVKDAIYLLTQQLGLPPAERDWNHIFEVRNMLRIMDNDAKAKQKVVDPDKKDKEEAALEERSKPWKDMVPWKTMCTVCAHRSRNGNNCAWDIYRQIRNPTQEDCPLMRKHGSW